MQKKQKIHSNGVFGSTQGLHLITMPKGWKKRSTKSKTSKKSRRGGNSHNVARSKRATHKAKTVFEQKQERVRGRSGGPVLNGATCAEDTKAQERARQVGKCFIKIARYVADIVGVDMTRPLSTTGLTNWDASVSVHKGSRNISIHFAEAAGPVILSVNDLLSGSITVATRHFRETRTIFLPDIYKNDADIIALASTTCRPHSKFRSSTITGWGNNSVQEYENAMTHASNRLKCDPEFVARLLKQHNSWEQRFVQTQLWHHASVILRRNKRYTLGLIIKHGCNRDAIVAGATYKTRRFLLRYLAMIPLALCAQRMLHSYRPDNAEPAVSRVVCAVPLNIMEFVG